MEVTCGTDIIEIERIKESIVDEKTGQMFLNRVFTEKEIDYCESKKMQKFQHYAARFAAKEAVFKAISIKLKDKYAIEWKDIEVENNVDGRPKINIKNNEIQQPKNIDVSLSHCKEYATAMVVVTY